VCLGACMYIIMRLTLRVSGVVLAENLQGGPRVKWVRKGGLSDGAHQKAMVWGTWGLSALSITIMTCVWLVWRRAGRSEGGSYGAGPRRRRGHSPHGGISTDSMQSHRGLARKHRGNNISR
jgi:hypothetical protein